MKYIWTFNHIELHQVDEICRFWICKELFKIFKHYLQLINTSIILLKYHRPRYLESPYYMIYIYLVLWIRALTHGHLIIIKKCLINVFLMKMSWKLITSMDRALGLMYGVNYHLPCEKCGSNYSSIGLTVYIMPTIWQATLNK